MTADPDAFVTALRDLQELTVRLRRDCPWDREQTTKTIVPHTLEEAYEVADAALAGDDAKLLDELGDLLFQTTFLACLLSERGAGDLEQVARAITAKLIARHPHVFGADTASNANEVRANWERLKVEQESREGVFHDVPDSFPATIFARKIQRRAASVGFDYPDAETALRDLDEELAELRAEIPSEGSGPGGPGERLSSELGDLLFAGVNVARKLDIDPELELRRAAQRFRSRVEGAVRLAAADGVEFHDLELAEQDRYFDAAKELV